MKKNVPDERKTKAILELICALDGRIVKVEDAGDGLLLIYSNIAQYPDEEDYEDDELLPTAIRPARTIVLLARRTGVASTTVLIAAPA